MEQLLDYITYIRSRIWSIKIGPCEQALRGQEKFPRQYLRSLWNKNENVKKIRRSSNVVILLLNVYQRFCFHFSFEYIIKQLFNSFFVYQELSRPRFLLSQTFALIILEILNLSQSLFSMTRDLMTSVSASLISLWGGGYWYVTVYTTGARGW